MNNFKVKDVLYVVILALLLGLPLASWAFVYGKPIFALSLLYSMFFPAYIVTLIVDCNNLIMRTIKVLVCAIATIWCIVGCFCAIKFHCMLSSDIVQIIAETNIDEFREFVEVFLSIKYVLTFIVPFPFLFVLYYKLKDRLTSKFRLFIHLISILSLTALIHHRTVIGNLLTNWNENFLNSADLGYQLPLPNINETDSIHPTNIIVIVGESFSKNHCQLYQYGKETNPRLLSREQKGNLFVFSNVISPKATTSSAFRYILNSYTLQESSERGWYNSWSIIQIFSKIGYKTTWLSNQAAAGVWDNIPASNAKMCDTVLFSPKMGQFDEWLLSKDCDMIDCEKYNFVVYNLFGQHENFKERFPERFTKFTKKDYPNAKEHQRQTLADYDNATLYNDYIVDNLIKKYETSPCIVFYFPDHGLDLYDTSDDYFGHARGEEASQNHCKEIPFMVYVSPLYMEKKPTLKTKIDSIKDIPFCTDHFFFLVLDLVGYEIKGHLQSQGLAGTPKIMKG